MEENKNKVNILGISLCPKKEAKGVEILEMVLDSANRVEDVETELVFLADKDIIGCIHCNWCVESQEEGVYCSIDDDMQELYPKVLKADAMVAGTPRNMRNMTWKWKSFLDRLRAFGEGRFYGLAGPKGPQGFGKVISSTSFIWPYCGIESGTIRFIAPALLLGGLPVGPIYSEFKSENFPNMLSGEELQEKANQFGERIANVTRDLKAGDEVRREMPAYL